MLLARHVGWTCRIARPIDTSDAPPTSAEPAYATRRTARHVVLDVSIRHVRRAASLVGCGTLDMSDAPRRGVGRDTLDTSDAPRHGVGRDTLDTSDRPDTSPCRPDTSDGRRLRPAAIRSTRPTCRSRRVATCRIDMSDLCLSLAGPTRATCPTHGKSSQIRASKRTIRIILPGTAFAGRARARPTRRDTDTKAHAHRRCAV